MATDLILDIEVADAKKTLDIKDYLEKGLVVADKTWVPSLAVSVSNKRDLTELKALEEWQLKVEKGEILKPQTSLASKPVAYTMEEVKRYTQLNRAWTPQILEDAMNDVRCPLDLHLRSDDYGTTTNTKEVK